MDRGKIVFGTMRMNVKGTYREHYTLLSSMFERGIDTHHTSAEYDSFSLYQKLHQQLHDEKKYIKHITKIAAPDFKENRFSAVKFVKRIDEELARLGKDQLEIVQWMFRMENLDDKVRVARFKQDYEEMNATFRRLQKEGKVLKFGHFPYTPIFADQVAVSNLTSSLITYLNAFELAYLACVERTPTIAIRPFAAGKIREVLTNKLAMNHIMDITKLTLVEANACVKLLPLLVPTVESVIVSINNENQLNDLADCAAVIDVLQKRYHNSSGIIKTIGESVKLIN